MKKIAFITVLILSFGLLFFNYAISSPSKKKHEHNGNHSQHGHDESSLKKTASRILEAKDVTAFLKLFNLIEKELNKLNKTQFNSVESFVDKIKESTEIASILKDENETGNRYIEIFNSITSAYNEIKMVRFEETIKKNQHEKFVYREGLMLDHDSKDHKVLHDVQAENFSEDFDEDGLMGAATEPKENINLVSKYEVELDNLFKN